MTPFRAYISLAVLLVLSVSVCAQTGADVTFKLQRKGFDQFPIAVDDFTIVRGAEAQDDFVLAANLAQIVRNDLSFHIAFNLIPIDSFLMEVLELESMTRRAWVNMGAQYLVTGEVEFLGGDVSVRYKLWDLGWMRDIRSDGFKTTRSNYRALAHSISDDVVRQVAGMKPLFNSKLVFVSARSGNKEIYVCDYDGANERAITANGSINISPVWDTEGRSIYYTSFKDDRPELWRVELGGGRHSKIAGYKGINSAAAISPGNDMICLTLSKDDDAELYMLDMTGAILRRLTHTRAIETSPSFGPDGHTIAFVSDRAGSRQIYLMDDYGLNVQRITYLRGANESPALSPDGSKIAFVTTSARGTYDVCIADVTGENPRLITNTGRNENPQWAPDSYHLVYTSTTGGVSDLYITDFQGIQRRKISKDGVSSNPNWSRCLW